MTISPEARQRIKTLARFAFLRARDARLGCDVADMAAWMLQAAEIGAACAETGTPATVLHVVERETILRVYESRNGDAPAAAELLGVSVKTLYRKLEEYGVRDKMTQDYEKSSDR